jgi:hypothetical protein
MDDGARRRDFLAYFSCVGLASTLFPGALWAKMLLAKAYQERTRFYLRSPGLPA